MRACTRQIAHTADVMITIHADTLDELFAEAARFIARYAGPPAGDPDYPVDLRLDASDTATLLADWLNELLARSEIACAALAPDAVTVAGSTLTARMRATPLREWRCPLKAATYHDLRLERRNGRWRAQVLCDA